MENQKRIAVIEPITPAWNHMVRILFKPFDFKKWLGLGFCAFLAQCAEQGGGGSNSWSSPLGNTPNGNQMTHWIDANFYLFITLVSVVVLLIFCLILFLVWISSRGKFMLLDGIVKNRGAIKEPWVEFKTLANSLFFLTIGVELLMLLCFGIIGGIGVLIALPDIEAEMFTGYGVTAIVVTGVLLLIFIIACIVVTFFMQVFLVPTMYIKRVRAIEGWKKAWAQFYSGHKWTALLFFLMWLLLSFCVGTLAVTTLCIAMCATCCIAALPYVSSVILLPVSVFFVCYALMYIQQFGDGWTFFRDMCSKCNYELRGLEKGSVCPECGHSSES